MDSQDSDFVAPLSSSAGAGGQMPTASDHAGQQCGDLWHEQCGFPRGDQSFCELSQYVLGPGGCLRGQQQYPERDQKSRLLNAIASPNVLIRSAVMASCAIPGVFPPVVMHPLEKIT